MSITDEAVVARQETALSNRVGDSVMMMDIDSGAYFELDETGAAIWGLLEKPTSFGELCRLLTERYEVEPGLCRVETAKFVSELKDLGLVDLS